MRILLLILVVAGCFSARAQTNWPAWEKAITTASADYINVYKRLHAAPELSTKEVNTAAFLKSELRQLGLEIIDSLGYHSFAAVLKNGAGPVVWYRTDMDGLPVQEQTGWSFASNNSAMHACGHDIHMSTWLGTAKLFTQMRKHWSGTLVLLAQSAEETGQGAKKIIASNGYKRLPTPTAILGMHDHASLPAAQTGFCNGYSMAAVDMMNITVLGKGGHGAVPNKTVDPVVLASQYVLALQTIVSRNLPTTESAVITVGAIQGGSVGNIVPDKVELRLTIRSFSETTRQLIFDRIKTLGNHLALAAGLDSSRLPVYDLLDMSIPSVYNDPALGMRLKNTLVKQFGTAAVTDVDPVMIGEDFGIYGRHEKNIPAYILWMGTAAKGAKEDTLPSLHSPRFAPDYAATLPGAVKVMSSCIIELLSKH